jgi:hypothetical protein
MAPAEPEAPRYRLGPRSTRGLIAGWRTGQIACVAVSLVFSLGLLRSVGGGLGALFALAVTGTGVAAATWPLAGRTAEQWAPTAASFGLRSVAEGRHRPWQALRRPAPGTFARLSLFACPGPELQSGDTARDVEPAGSGIGVIGDAEASTWSAVVPVGGTGFALLGDAERADRIAAWSGLLAAMARDAGLYRLQWVSSSYPAWLDSPLASEPGGSAGEDYGRLLRDAGPNLWAHEVLVVVTVRHVGASRRGPEVAASQLRGQLSSVEERLRSAGLSPGRPLSPRALATRVRRSFETEPIDEPICWPWPVGIDAGWSRLRTDATWHATYWIAEWPRCDVGPGFLLPVLLVPGVRKAVSVTMAPLPSLAAVRRAERDRTEGTADAELRNRHGFAVTARARREQEGRQQREAELAEGHAGYRYSGYVTVTESDEGALEHACGRVEQAAALAQLELRRLYGAQEDGYCCTLPTGRGCR